MEKSAIPRTSCPMSAARFLAGLAVALLSVLATGTERDPPADATTADTCRIHFAVIGDFGLAGTSEARVAHLVKSWRPDLIVSTGDNNYPSGAFDTIDLNIGQYYHEYIHPYAGRFGPGADENRFFPVLGNHDWRTESAAPYLAYFRLPGNERYYELVRGPVHFFFLDSDEHEPDGIDADSRQARWLHAALRRSKAPWRIVVLHRPPFSSGTTHGSAQELQWPFAAWGADLVLAGHEHVYERIEIDGVRYLTVGTGGKDLYEFAPVPLPGSRARHAADFGALQVVATSRRLSLQFVTVNGTVADIATWRSGQRRTSKCGPLPVATRPVD